MMGTHSNIYLRMQLAARRATAGLAIANSREHNNADDCFLTGLKEASQNDNFETLCTLRYIFE